MGNGDAEPDEEAGAYEHADVAGDGLKHDAEQHDDAADHDTSATAQNIGGVGNGGDGDERAHGHDAVEQAEDRARGVVKVGLPGVEGL